MSCGLWNATALAVPVVSDGKIVGIISRANLIQALARLADEAPESPGTTVADVVRYQSGLIVSR